MGEGSLDMSTIDEAHPLFLGILNITSRYRSKGKASQKGNVLGKYSDNHPFAVEHSSRDLLTISINVFPVCRDFEDGGWRSMDSDGAELFANALLYTGVRSLVARAAFPF